MFLEKDCLKVRCSKPLRTRQAVVPTSTRFFDAVTAFIFYINVKAKREGTETLPYNYSVFWIICIKA